MTQPKQSFKNKKNDFRSKLMPVLFFLFFGFIIVILRVIHNTDTLDQVMMPRLYSINLFLLLFTLIYFMAVRKEEISWPVLRQYLFPLLGLWLVISAISLLFATNPVEGLYDILKALNAVAIVILGCLLLVKTDSWENKIIFIVAIAVIIASVIGLVQYFDRVFHAEEKLLSLDRDPFMRPIIYLVDGLMAHKNLFSISLFMALPFTIAGIFIQKSFWRWISVVALILQLILILLLQTRAVWVGIMIATTLTILLVLAMNKQFQLPKIWRTVMIAVLLIGAVSASGVLYLSSTDTQNQYIQQFRSITDTSAPQNIHRINIWRSSVEMISEKPITGYGPGNWKLHVSSHFQNRFDREEQLNWQRPHNDFLWIWGEKGIFGLLIFLGIFALSFYYLFKVILSKDAPGRKILALMLIFGFTGYLVISFFDFPYERVYHQMFLAVMLACTIVLYHKNYPAGELKVNRLALVIPLLAVFAFGSVYGHKAVKQEKEFKKARAQIRMRNWNGVLHYTSRAHNPLKNLDPQANPLAFYEGLAYVNLGDMKTGMDKLLKAYDQHPGNINLMNSLGAALFENEEYDKAREVLEKSLSIFRSQDGTTNLSAVLLQLEEYEKAREVILKLPEEQRTDLMKRNLKGVEARIRGRDGE